MKEFSYPLEMGADLFLQKARKAAARYGARLTGDQQSGRFTGQGLEGEYRIDGQTLHLILSKKPVFISQSKKLVVMFRSLDVNFLLDSISFRLS